jgi:hypothetical protein
MFVDESEEFFVFSHGKGRPPDTAYSLFAFQNEKSGHHTIFMNVDKCGTIIGYLFI